MSSYRVMKTRRYTRRPLILLSITSGLRMRTAALHPRLTLASSSTSSSSVRLLWKVSSFEAILCFHVPVSDYPVKSSCGAHSPHGANFSNVFHNTVCAHLLALRTCSLTHIWKTSGSLWWNTLLIKRVTRTAHSLMENP